MDISNVKLGSKIKELRTLRKMTQTELAGKKITRNMLSEIESGTANPSLSTLIYLADKLDISPAYFFLDEGNLFYFDKKRIIDKVYSLLKTESYKECIKLISSLNSTDDETAYIMAVCYFNIGKKALLTGSLKTAIENLDLSLQYSEKTVFNTDHLKAPIIMYKAVASNIQSPLLEFNKEEYEKALLDTTDYEFYKYIILDFDYEYKNSGFKLHIEGKKLLKERKYSEALPILLSAVDHSKSEGYNSYLIFSLYADIESCYKILYDFENAYQYSSKRHSMIEGFKS